VRVRYGNRKCDGDNKIVKSTKSVVIRRKRIIVRGSKSDSQLFECQGYSYIFTKNKI